MANFNPLVGHIANATPNDSPTGSSRLISALVGFLIGAGLMWVMTR